MKSSLRSKSEPKYSWYWRNQDISKDGFVAANTKSEARSLVKKLFNIKNSRLPKIFEIDGPLPIEASYDQV